MRFRRFTNEGLALFQNYLERLKAEDPKLDPPPGLLDEDRYTTLLDPAIEADPIPFARRMDFVCWLHDAAVAAGADIPRTDTHFWAWLDLALFEQVCPKNGHGKRSPGSIVRHIPDFSRWTRRYRHLLANPYDIYHAHQDDPWRAMVGLINPLHKPGELSEQFASRIELITCPGSLALATRLYINKDTGERRKGASGKSARRFGKVMNQYTRTYDLPEMEPKAFAAMLPKEFKTFVHMAEDTEAAVAP